MSTDSASNEPAIDRCHNCGIGRTVMEWKYLLFTARKI